MTLLDQLKAVLRSRKFWVLVAALVATAAAYGQGQIDAWQAVQAVVAATSTYALATAYEDANKITAIEVSDE